MKKLLSTFSVFVLLFSLNLLFMPDAEARFSGGHSSSSSSSSSHSSSSSSSYSSGDDDIDLIIFILKIAFEYPLATFICLIIAGAVWMIDKRSPQTIIFSRSSGSFKDYRLKEQVIRNLAPASLEKISQGFGESQLSMFKQQDNNFSRILFLDFVHLLYVKYYSYYGKPEVSYLTPYLDDAVQHDKKLDLLISNQIIVISEIIINSVRLYSIDSMGDEDRIVVEIESNYTIHPAFHTEESGKQHTRYISTERWSFQRAKTVSSLPPEKMQALTCPTCGAPAHFTDAGECSSCRTVIAKGQQQWYVKERYVLNQSVLNTGDLVAYSEEQGTDLLTITSSAILQEITAFETQSAVVWSDYWKFFKQQIVHSYFLELNAAWTNRRLNKVRHLISDRLYEANSFWMDLYQQHNWTNCLDDLKIKDIQLAKIEIDAYYEVITVRIFASCFDYTVDSQNKVIGGSNKKLRNYTEYWTFARRAGKEHSQTPFDLTVCPQCAAPADKMGQSAICEYCGAKISTGEFSWVLFLITQDENYQG